MSWVQRSLSQSTKIVVTKALEGNREGFLSSLSCMALLPVLAACLGRRQRGSSWERYEETLVVWKVLILGLGHLQVQEHEGLEREGGVGCPQGGVYHSLGQGRLQVLRGGREGA